MDNLIASINEYQSYVNDYELREYLKEWDCLELIESPLESPLESTMTEEYQYE